MATNANTASKTAAPKAPKKPQKPFVERMDEQLKKQVLGGKITAEELTGFQEKLGKYITVLETLK